MARTPTVLSIAGSDPSGGAGIQADLKTFAALGVYGCAVPVALTAQNTRGVSDVMFVGVDFIARQIDVVLEDITVDVVKIGMLGTAATVRVVAEALRRHSIGTVVLDPVLRASEGAHGNAPGELLDEDGLAELRASLLPLATIVTPNTYEAGVLARTQSPTSVEAAEITARAIHAFGVRNVLVTGGHLDHELSSVDVLFDGARTVRFAVPRVRDARVHGAGCTLSSAIAALLARGRTVDEACEKGQRFTAAAIVAAETLTVGGGARPVHQLGANE